MHAFLAVTIPVPAWVCLLFALLVVAREYFAAQRDQAVRDLFAQYVECYPSAPSPEN